MGKAKIAAVTPSRTGLVHQPTLAFLGTLAFATTFLVVRTFTTLCPTCIVMQGGIHFHHFWYGLAMIAVAGWLGIAWKSGETLNRVYAIVYGVGAGLIGDEVGLLLTLGNYQSELTYQFFIGAVSLAILAILLLRYWSSLKRDILGLRQGERLSYLGIFIAGLSAILFAADIFIPGVIIAALGAALIILGIVHHMRSRLREPGKPA